MNQESDPALPGHHLSLPQLRALFPEHLRSDPSAFSLLPALYLDLSPTLHSWCPSGPFTQLIFLGRLSVTWLTVHVGCSCSILYFSWIALSVFRVYLVSVCALCQTELHEGRDGVCSTVGWHTVDTLE